MKPRLPEWQRHSFQQTAMRYVEKGMPVEYPIQVRVESKIARDLTHSAVEHPDSYVGKGRQVLGISGVTDKFVGRRNSRSAKNRKTVCDKEYPSQAWARPAPTAFGHTPESVIRY
jgi:hypothetical protein